MDLDAVRAQAAEVMGRFEHLQSEYGQLQEKVLKINAVAKSADGYVTATVGSYGQLVKLELDPRIYRRPNSRELAATITKTVQEAARKASAELAEACSPFMPDAQFQAHMDFDVNGILEHYEQNLPQGESSDEASERSNRRSS